MGKNFLQGWNGTAKEIVVSLAIIINLQGNMYSSKVGELAYNKSHI